jgi:hypothetical protein
MKNARATPFFLAVVALLQAYQLFKLHTIQLAAGDGSIFLACDGALVLPFSFPKLCSSFQLRRQSSSATPPVSPRLPQREVDEGFSACLMIMDDNAHLIEWLAYHYTRLPLRRLIVAVDPRSKTSPTEILRRWDGLMEITEWSDVDFMPPPLMDSHVTVSEQDDKKLTTLFRRRQEEFYTRCMARLKYEGSTWTAFIDTDEYILINSHAVDKYRIPTTSRDGQDRSAGMTIVQAIRQAEKENEHLASAFAESPCVAVPRVSFGVRESSSKEAQRGVPYGFDGMDFQTLRWRWHNGRGDKKVNKISKSILDVSRVASDLFVPTEQVMVHLPSKMHCHGGHGEKHLWALNSYSPFVIHHYAGTWEQWSHRKDTRGRRTRENYAKLMYNKTTDDAIRPWLQDFVNHVGWWKARRLLWKVGMIPEV